MNTRKLIAASVITIGGLAISSPALAHHPDIEVTSYCLDGGRWGALYIINPDADRPTLKWTVSNIPDAGWKQAVRGRGEFAFSTSLPAEMAFGHLLIRAEWSNGVKGETDTTVYRPEGGCEPEPTPTTVAPTTTPETVPPATTQPVEYPPVVPSTTAPVTEPPATVPTPPTTAPADPSTTTSPAIDHIIDNVCVPPETCPTRPPQPPSTTQPHVNTTTTAPLQIDDGATIDMPAHRWPAPAPTVLEADDTSMPPPPTIDITGELPATGAGQRIALLAGVVLLAGAVGMILARRGEQ